MTFAYNMYVVCNVCVIGLLVILKKTFDSDGGYFRHRAANISHPMAKIAILWRKYPSRFCTKFRPIVGSLLAKYQGC